MELDKITIGEIKELLTILNLSTATTKHPMLGRRCVVRTYSAGVHIGNVVFVNEMECKPLHQRRRTPTQRRCRPARSVCVRICLQQSGRSRNDNGSSGEPT